MTQHAPRIAEITAADTAAIRRDVLRRGTTSDDVTFPGDTDPTTIHLGAYLDGELVAISTWLPGATPPHEILTAASGDTLTVRLRGMGIRDDLQERGIGSQLLRAGCDRARRLGAGVVWAHARDTALGFYEREGFEVLGEGFVTSDTGLAHHLVRLPL